MIIRLTYQATNISVINPYVTTRSSPVRSGVGHLRHPELGVRHEQLIDLLHPFLSTLVGSCAVNQLQPRLRTCLVYCRPPPRPDSTHDSFPTFWPNSATPSGYDIVSLDVLTTHPPSSDSNRPRRRLNTISSLYLLVD